MAALALRVCEQRASQAEEIVATLKRQLQLITSQATNSAGTAQTSQEVVRLQDENNSLTKQVEALKQRLCYLEIMNGKKQVQLPKVSSTATSSNKNDASPPKAAKTVEQSPTNPDNKGKPDQKKEKKQKKAEAETKKNAKNSKPIDISRLNLKIGHIVSVKKHPDADSLYVEEVNVGEESPRTIVSGLVRHIPIEGMQDRLAIFCCNLKPAKMRGILSQGMIMCASSPEKVEIINPPEGCVPGDRVVVEEYPGEPDTLLNPKKKIFEQIQPDLRTNDECIATYKGCKWTVKGKGICKAPTMAGFNIK
ncbi:uncharacterized protein TRIADDRAFT_20863 [Trichoplax adhaerens]|uniref:tRNA-binding domain-containing protein n=1 Tax=Trichoplax adhaerens TaxID=10228 RepID=B3RNJ1_TRIAD|nr:hypothetical protein TRIADDRAFT_20863 [Trichoplax adhaerens]EDV28031.1 hypothetical protein TRIADDRAFT_20863 [Trichoplax adhaerens]|eukprot:XP_002109865.1 hypothetical protein TRIADDRAFT_20863 [Trichoplax adhaerens]